MSHPILATFRRALLAGVVLPTMAALPAVAVLPTLAQAQQPPAERERQRPGGEERPTAPHPPAAAPHAAPPAAAPEPHREAPPAPRAAPAAPEPRREAPPAPREPAPAPRTAPPAPELRRETPPAVREPAPAPRLPAPEPRREAPPAVEQRREAPPAPSPQTTPAVRTPPVAPVAPEPRREAPPAARTAPGAEPRPNAETRPEAVRPSAPPVPGTAIPASPPPAGTRPAPRAVPGEPRPEGGRPGAPPAPQPPAGGPPPAGPPPAARSGPAGAPGAGPAPLPEAGRPPSVASPEPQRGPGAPQAAPPAGPQAGPPRGAADPTGRGGGLSDLRTERRLIREGDRTIITEPGGRVFIQEGGRTIIRRDESERFRYGARDVQVQQRGGETVTIVDRPDGDQVVTYTDRDGNLIRRSRRGQDGREVVIIDNRPRPGDPGTYFVDLPPPVIRIPRERYIVEAQDAPYEVIYDTFLAPPVERIDRRYTLDEIRYSPEVRSRMPRVDIDTVTFASGSWEVTPDQAGRLSVIARALAAAIGRNPREVFLIEGHTDATGSAEDNLSLSDRRAEAVAVVLQDAFRIPPENLTTQGYGEQQLKVPSNGPERINRRVTIRRITPLLTGDSGGPPPR